MANTIQTALKNCVQREVEKLKKYDWGSNSDDNVTYLIGGCVLGVAAVTLIASAGGIAHVPAYVDLKTAPAQMVMSQFVSDHAHAIMGVGGSIVGAGALMFLKGLKEENKVLQDRVALAFNKLGHGVAHIREVESAYDAIIDNNAAIVREINAERKWISDILDKPTQAQAAILAPTGAHGRDTAVIDTLKAAYIHGVKKSFVEGIQNHSVTYGRLGNPSMTMEKSIISGMLDYYVAADKKVPSVVDKLHFVLVGDPDVLKSPERANQLTSNAINAILEIKGKTVVPREPRIEPAKAARRERYISDDLSL